MKLEITWTEWSESVLFHSYVLRKSGIWGVTFWASLSQLQQITLPLHSCWVTNTYIWGYLLRVPVFTWLMEQPFSSPVHHSCLHPCATLLAFWANWINQWVFVNVMTSPCYVWIIMKVRKCSFHIRNSRHLGRSVAERFSGGSVLMCPISHTTGRSMIHLQWNWLCWV